MKNKQERATCENQDSGGEAGLSPVAKVFDAVSHGVVIQGCGKAQKASHHFTDGEPLLLQNDDS
jgi:hypothetical protein